MIGCYNDLDLHFPEGAVCPFVRGGNAWTTIAIKTTQTENDARADNPETGPAPAARLPARVGAVPPPIADMREEARRPTAERPPATSAVALPRIAQARPASMVDMSAVALPQTARAHPASTADMSAVAHPRIAQARPTSMAQPSAAALPQTARAHPADNTADTTARPRLPVRPAGRVPARAAAEPPAAPNTGIPARARRPAPAAAGDTAPPAGPKRKRRRGVTAFAFNREHSSSSRSLWS